MAALFYCEFDNQYGRTLVYQEPSGAVSAEEFDTISDFLIPKPQLCGYLVVLRSEVRVVLSWPVCLENARYERNALFFSLGFLVEQGFGAATANSSLLMRAGKLLAWDIEACARYGPTLKKACAHLSALEREVAALSDESRKSELGHLMPQLLRGLQVRGSFGVAADSANTIQLPPWKLRLSAPTRAVGNLFVPLLLVVPDAITMLAWDFTLHMLLLWVDGTRNTAALAAVANADLSVVRQSLEALRGSGWVQMVDGCAWTL